MQSDSGSIENSTRRQQAWLSVTPTAIQACQLMRQGYLEGYRRAAELAVMMWQHSMYHQQPEA
jgi:hypothetical protein